MLSFFSSRRNWDSPTPLAAGECAPHPLVRGGREGKLACGRGVGGLPIPTRGHTLWSIYIKVLCAKIYDIPAERGHVAVEDVCGVAEEDDPHLRAAHDDQPANNVQHAAHL